MARSEKRAVEERELSGNWRRLEEEEEEGGGAVRAMGYCSGQGIEVGGLVGLRSRTLCDL